MMAFELRPWRFDDAASLAAHANNPRVAQNLRDAFPCPYREEDAVRYIRSCLDSSEARQLVYAVTVDDMAVGSAGIFRREDIQCRTAEIGYWLGEDFWGRGIATGVIRELCARGFARYDIARIEAWVFAGNHASRRALEKNGFLCEGILRNSVWKNGLQDCCVYALLREEFAEIQTVPPGKQSDFH